MRPASCAAATAATTVVVLLTLVITVIAISRSIYSSSRFYQPLFSTCLQLQPFTSETRASYSATPYNDSALCSWLWDLWLLLRAIRNSLPLKSQPNCWSTISNFKLHLPICNLLVPLPIPITSRPLNTLVRRTKLSRVSSKLNPIVRWTYCMFCSLSLLLNYHQQSSGERLLASNKLLVKSLLSSH